MYETLIDRIKEVQHITEPTPLHAPIFKGREREYVLDTIESTFVSSVGEYVNRFERMLEEITGVTRAVACVNGTAALEMALRLAAGAEERSGLVITQALSFVATANAITHSGGRPAFVDVDESLGMSPEALDQFLSENCVLHDGVCRLKASGERVSSCVPMHTFGLPCRIREICDICRRWGIAVVEDAAEALGSLTEGVHCGSFGLFGTLSFNGNKIVTTGGGGAILTNDEALGAKAKHLTCTAKLPHSWEFRHDQLGWNYRLPNINAALGCAQLEQLDAFLEIKRKRAELYAQTFEDSDWEFVREPAGSRSNYWLCAVLTGNRAQRDAFLKEANEAGLGSRPVWEPLHTLPMYADCPRGDLSLTMDIAGRLVNLPSGVGPV